MKRTNHVLRIKHLLKGLLAGAVGNFVGYLFYLVFLNAKNAEDPKGASAGTAVFSFIFFALTTAFTYYLATFGSNDPEKPDEETLLEETFKNSGYSLDYKAYFAGQFRSRTWIYLFVELLFQIPLFVNYYIALGAGYGTVFSCPINFYRFGMASVFSYELLGDLWFLGPVVDLLLFGAVFFFLLYKGQKKWMVKPSYID